MGRRIFLALLMGVALSSARAAAQSGAQPPPQVPADRVTVEEFKTMLADKKPVLVLDVRHEVDRKIKGAMHIPLDQVESRHAELPRDREIITYCA